MALKNQSGAKRHRNWRSDPYHRAPERPNFHRRAWFHDYSAPGRYMITLLRNPELPELSEITGNLHAADPAAPDFPTAIPTQAGACVLAALRDFTAHYEATLRVDAIVIMPDHVHICIDVFRFFPPGSRLSSAISFFMGRCTRHYRESAASGSGSTPPEGAKFFARGFNDSIAFTLDQYETQKRYVIDNPRRLLLKRTYKYLYFRRNVITIDGVEYDAFGNLFLLRNAVKEAVKYSSRLTEAANAANMARWKRCVEAGGVLVSPFIHRFEKEARDYAIREGGFIIRFCENGFPERFAPSGVEFDLMAEGRLLLIGPKEFRSLKQDISRARCRELNELAARLVAPSAWLAMGLRPGPAPPAPEPGA